MKTLDLTERGYLEVKITEAKSGKVKVLKLPTELTVAQVEAILELQLQAEEVARQKVKDDGIAQAKLFFGKVFSQLFIMFGVLNKGITEEYLKENFSEKDAFEIAGYFNNSRFLKISEQSTAISQKKTQLKTN